MKAVRTSLPLVLACGLLAACGGGGGGGTASSGIADKSAAQIAQAARDAVAKAQSLHMKGNITSNGVGYAMDLVINSPKGLAGTMVLTGQGSFSITTVDGATFYLKPDEKFWTTYAGSDPAVLRVLNGKCLRVSSGDAGFGSLVTGLSKLSDLGQLFSAAPASNSQSLSKGPAITVNGQPAIELKAADGTTIDVATQGSPYPLRVSKTGAAGGTLDLDRWDSAGAIAAPSGCKSVNDLVAGAASPTP